MLQDKPHWFVFVQNKFMEASFISLQDKPNSNSCNYVERNLNWAPVSFGMCHHVVYQEFAHCGGIGYLHPLPWIWRQNVPTKRTWHFRRSTSSQEVFDGNLPCVQTSTLWNTGRKEVWNYVGKRKTLEQNRHRRTWMQWQPLKYAYLLLVWIKFSDYMRRNNYLNFSRVWNPTIDN